MNELKITNNMFESIKHIDEMGNEYWLARELMSVLGYSKWERFSNAIEYAKYRVLKVDMTLMTIFPRLGKWFK